MDAYLVRYHHFHWCILGFAKYLVYRIVPSPEHWTLKIMQNNFIVRTKYFILASITYSQSNRVAQLGPHWLTPNNEIGICFRTMLYSKARTGQNSSCLSCLLLLRNLSQCSVIRMTSSNLPWNLPLIPKYVNILILMKFSASGLHR